MKKISFLIAGCLFTFIAVKGQVNQKESHVVIAQPEYNVLYRNYENKLIFASHNGQLKDVKAVGANMTEEIIDGKMGYIVIPEAGSRMCSFITTVLDKDGITHVDTSNYTVRSFPQPHITNELISKTGGGRIHVALSPDSPLNGIEYEVIAIDVFAVDGGYCSGDVIPPAFLASFRSGDRVGFMVTAKNLYTGALMVISGSVRVE
jgi:hypothetical protein